MKFHRLEAVRGFAAVYVCVGHILFQHRRLHALFPLFHYGQEAVMVFFVLSGFVVYWATMKDERSLPLRDYLWKRFARIYSIWILAAVALFAIVSVENGQWATMPLSQLVGNALMLQDFSGKPAVICRSFFGDIPLWSLHYEWWFYMLFPLVIAGVKPRLRSHAIGIAAVISSIIYVLVPNPLNRILIYLSVWWIGAHAAGCLRRCGSVTLADLRWPLIYAALSAVPLVLLCWLWRESGQPLELGTHPVLETRHLIMAIVLVLLAFLWRRVGWLGFAWTVGPFRYAAPISFSLYVIHYRSIAVASYLSFMHSRAAEFAGYATLTIGFCWLAELVVYPLVRKLNAFGGARRLQSPPGYR